MLGGGIGEHLVCTCTHMWADCILSPAKVLSPTQHLHEHLFCLYTVEYLLCVRHQLAFLSVLSYFLKHICGFPDLLLFIFLNLL